MGNVVAAEDWYRLQTFKVVGDGRGYLGRCASWEGESVIR